MAWRSNIIVCGGTYCYEVKIKKIPKISFIGWSSLETVAWYILQVTLHIEGIELNDINKKFKSR
jgi:hypothetical protein